jgi:hypothetical protein
MPQAPEKVKANPRLVIYVTIQNCDIEYELRMHTVSSLKLVAPQARHVLSSQRLHSVNMYTYIYIYMLNNIHQFTFHSALFKPTTHYGINLQFS